MRMYEAKQSAPVSKGATKIYPTSSPADRAYAKDE